jgi:hypothetical protein
VAEEEERSGFSAGREMTCLSISIGKICVRKNNAQSTQRKDPLYKNSVTLRVYLGQPGWLGICIENGLKKKFNFRFNVLTISYLFRFPLDLFSHKVHRD